MAIFPSQSFDGSSIKAQWGERYTTETINQKFLGMPRGVYAGFIPALDSDPNKLQLNVDSTSGISLIRVQSGQESAMIDILTKDQILLDFSGHGDWPVYVVARADYITGSPSTGSLLTRKTPANGPTEVTVCKIDRPGNQGALVISPSTVFPTNDVTSRQEPYAFDDAVGPPATPGQNFGFLPKGSYEDLIAAADTTSEVEAARQFSNGLAGTDWDSGNPQTTGLPDRLNKDLSAKGIGDRIGKQFISVRSNNISFQQNIIVRLNVAPSGSFIFDETVTSATGTAKFQNIIGSGPYYIGLTLVSGVFQTGQLLTGGSSSVTGTIASNTTLDAITYNISGSYSARRRYSLVGLPFVDSTTTAALPANPFISIEPGGSESFAGAIVNTSVTGATLTLSVMSGEFLVGEKISNTNSPAGNRIGVVQSWVKPYLTISYIQGTFLSSDTLVGNISAATGTVSSVSALTLSDSTRNVGFVVENTKGERFTDSSGNTVYGRVYFQTQSVLSGNLTFVNSNDTVTTASDLTGVLRGGDIIQGADGRYYEVKSAVPTQITASNFKIDPPYVGNNATTSGLLLRRFTLGLNTKAAGAERCADVTTTVTSCQAFLPCFLSQENSNFDSDLLKLAPGGVPDASTTVKGKVILAADAATTSGAVVQATDSRLGTIKAQVNGGSTSTSKPIFNIVASTGISVAIDDTNPAKVTVTITNSSPGGGGATPYNSTPAQDSGAGSSGSSADYARGDHIHPASSAYRPNSYSMRTAFNTSTTNTASTATLPNASDTPRILLVIAYNSTVSSISVGAATGNSSQASATGSTNYDASNVVTSLTAGTWTAVFGSPGGQSVTINPNTVSGTWSKAMFLIGDGN